MHYNALNLNQLSFEVGIDYTERRKTKRKNLKYFKSKFISTCPKENFHREKKD